MEWFDSGLGLSLIVFLPLVGVVALMVVPKLSNAAARGIAMVVLLADFLLSLRLLGGFESSWNGVSCSSEVGL